MNDHLLMIVYIFLALILPASTLINSYNEYMLTKSLTNNGINANGYIISVIEDKAGYSIKYVFRVQGNEYFNTQMIPKEKFKLFYAENSTLSYDRAHKVKSSESSSSLINIRYIEENPGISRLLTGSEKNIFREKVVFSIILLVVFFIGFIIIFGKNVT